LSKKDARGGRGFGLNVGSASIIMLFAVLCLTVLAALSLLSANAQTRLAERSAETVKAYYTADTKASAVLSAMRSGDAAALSGMLDDTDVFITRETDIENGISDALIQTITVRVNDNLSLEVKIIDNTGSGADYTEISRKLAATGDWIPDESMDIWDNWG